MKIPRIESKDTVEKSELKDLRKIIKEKEDTFSLFLIGWAKERMKELELKYPNT